MLDLPLLPIPCLVVDLGQSHLFDRLSDILVYITYIYNVINGVSRNFQQCGSVVVEDPRMRKQEVQYVSLLIMQVCDNKPSSGRVSGLGNFETILGTSTDTCRRQYGPVLPKAQDLQKGPEESKCSQEANGRQIMWYNTSFNYKSSSFLSVFRLWFRRMRMDQVVLQV